MLLKIALFFVFFVWIGNGVGELDARKRENARSEKESSVVLVWLLGIILPILALAVLAIWHWHPELLDAYVKSALTF